MAKPRVNVLIEGFVDETGLHRCGTARYQPTITLVRAGEAVIVVDPGSVERQSDITRALHAHGVSVADVTHVILTHHHLDHARNVGMFADIPVIDGWATWTGIDFAISTSILPAGVRIEKTPGHTYDSQTVFVDTDDGITAICGDVLWSQNDTTSHGYAEDPEALKRSRTKILAHADYVIPGHAPIFAVEHNELRSR